MFICFTDLTTSNTSHPIENACCWSKGGLISKVHENGSVDPHKESQGRKKEEKAGREEGTHKILPYCLRAYAHCLFIKRTTYLGHIYLNIK